MEEKRYPQFDEEESVGMASEPIVDVAQPAGTTAVHDWIDDLDWDRFPILGPKTEEEAIARIEEAEKELDDPSKWVTSEQMWAELHHKFTWLR